MTKTARGFAFGEFTDLYGHECSIQKSSLATDDALWIGINDAAPKVMACEAHRCGVATDEKCGWVDYPIPNEVLLHTRMHLSREQATELIPVLQHFVDTGELE